MKAFFCIISVIGVIVLALLGTFIYLNSDKHYENKYYRATDGKIPVVFGDSAASWSLELGEVDEHDGEYTMRCPVTSEEFDIISEALGDEHYVDEVNMRVNFTMAGIDEIGYQKSLDYVKSFYAVGDIQEENEKSNLVEEKEPKIETESILRVDDITKLNKFKYLENLALYQTAIDDLEGIEKFPNLKTLSVSSNPYLVTINNVEKLPKLEEIYLPKDGVQYITEESYNYLKDSEIDVYYRENILFSVDPMDIEDVVNEQNIKII